MAQKSVGRYGRSKPVIESKKVVELGIYVTAGQLRRLEKILGEWSVKFSVLPEPDVPYRDLVEWREECSAAYKESVA